MASTIQKIITDASSHIDRGEAEILLSHALKKPREFVITHPEFFVPWPEDFAFQRFVAERETGKPLAYITGHKEFFGFDFIVNKDTLIPRPETELLVEKVITSIKEFSSDILLIDVGTGSGCIPVSLVKTLTDIPLHTFAFDISAKALAIAKKNAQKYFSPIQFLKSDLLQELLAHPSRFPLHFPLIITANLPYLTKEQVETEPSIQWEPLQALVADENGLALYKKLIGQISQLILNTKNISPLICFMEIDPQQAASLTQFIHTLFPQAQIEIFKDLRGDDRLVSFRLTFTA